MGVGKEKGFSKAFELAYELKIAEVMKRGVITVKPDDLMGDLYQILRVHRISGTPVVDGDRLVGVVSLEDFIRCLTDGEVDRRIEEKMSRQVVTVYEDEPLIHAIEKFEHYGFGRLPVLNRDSEKLVGILTKTDIIHGLLRELEVAYHEEEIRHYRASHFFEDIIADKTTLSFKYNVIGNDFKRAGEAAGSLKKTLTRLGIHPRILRRVAVATYEAEMNIVIYAGGGGEITAAVEPDQIRIKAVDEGPGIPDIEKALQPGFSTAPEWVRELGFGAGMGLPNIKKCADKMDLASQVGKGTDLQITIFMDKTRGDKE